MNRVDRERLLVLAPFGRDNAVIGKVLEDAGINSELCSSIDILCEKVNEGAGAAIIADEALEPAGVSALASTLRQQLAWSDFPIFVMTGGGESTDISRSRLRLISPLGAITLIERPLRVATFISSVRSALRSRSHQYRVCEALEKLAASNAELKRANIDLEQIAFSASHDLREPLRNLSIFSEILRRKGSSGLDDESRECLSFVLASARRMELLIRDLLSYIQLSRSAAHAQTDVDAKLVLRRVLAGFETLIEQTGAVIHADPIPDVRISEAHLEQLLQNLIGNAIKYHRHGVPPEVRIYSYESGDGIVICVRDNGIGIAPEHRNKIFGLFKRLHPTDQYEGTGLGLAICQRIVEQAGGEIWVESEPGKGALFCFKLPSAAIVGESPRGASQVASR